MLSKHENPLERLLRDATSEIGLRPEFYRCLLEADVFVPIEPAPGQGRDGKITAGSMLAIKTLVRNDGVGVNWATREGVTLFRPAMSVVPWRLWVPASVMAL